MADLQNLESGGDMHILVDRDVVVGDGMLVLRRGKVLRTGGG
jgi:hypothetical protein